MGAAAVFVAIATTIHGGGGRLPSKSVSHYVAYPALNSTAPIGLQLVTAQQRANPAFKADGPAWAAEPGTHGPNSPVPSTIRRLMATSPDITSWIAKSGEGGICVLASPNHKVHGVYVVGGSCTHSPDELNHGPILIRSDPESPGRVELAGVVPSDVTSVEIQFAKGRTKTAIVTDNGWTLKTTSLPLRFIYKPNGYAVSTGRS